MSSFDGPVILVAPNICITSGTKRGELRYGSSLNLREAKVETRMTRKQLNSRITQEIDRNLKQAFDDTANQPVPDRFTDLLAQLRAAEQSDSDRHNDA